MPSNVDVSAAPTSSDTGTFLMNTDFNYTKLIDADIRNTASATITHDLGYYPQAEVWWESGGWMRKIVDMMPSITDNPQAKITTSTLSLVPGTFISPDRWHYRIYEEEL